MLRWYAISFSWSNKGSVIIRIIKAGKSKSKSKSMSKKGGLAFLLQLLLLLLLLLLLSYLLMTDERAHVIHDLRNAHHAFLDYAGHFSIQAFAIGLGQIFGRDDDDRHQPTSRFLAQFLHELESVHLGHHQIQQDQCGNRPV